MAACNTCHQPLEFISSCMICRHCNVRCCVICGCTNTPLWRYGPCTEYGKSYCNACGIRLSRARKSPNTKYPKKVKKAKCQSWHYDTNFPDTPEMEDLIAKVLGEMRIMQPVM